MDLYPKIQGPEGYTKAELDLEVFGDDLHGYSNGDPEAEPLQLPTRLHAGFINQLVGELMTVLVRSGQAGSLEDLDQLWQAIAPASVGIYGDGSSQPPNIEEAEIINEVTLTEDWLGRRLGVRAGGHLRPNGWRLYINELLTIETGGLISNDELYVGRGLEQVVPLLPGRSGDGLADLRMPHHVAERPTAVVIHERHTGGILRGVGIGAEHKLVVDGDQFGERHHALIRRQRDRIEMGQDLRELVRR